MDRGGGSNGSCYYSILGIRKGASFSEIRCAYRKLALKWHPDRWGKNSKGAGEAKRRFQQIQEAYSVLSDQGKRSMYDAGFYDPFQEEEEEGFSDFMQEMISMMDNVRPGEESFEDLQKMFVEMASGGGGGDVGDRRPSSSAGKRGNRVSGSQGNVSKRSNNSGVSVSVSVSD